MTSCYRRLLSATGFVALALMSAPAFAVTQNICSFPTGLTTFTLNGNAFESLNSVIRLTDSGVASEAAAAWLDTPVALGATTSLHAYFRFKMGPASAGGDGLAFVLQNSTLGTAALGATAGSLGYSGITPSVVIKFDTFKNGTADPNANNVSILLNGVTTLPPAAQTATPGFTMAGAGILSAWVDYDGVGHALKVYLAQTATKPATALLSFSINLVTQLGAQAYLGFTSSTGTTAAEENEHDVYELDFSTTGIPCACEGDPACSGSTPACGAAGICTVCSATNATACTGATPVCDVPVNACVGCLTNANCAGSKPICDAGALACRACTSNADCGGSTPQCATTGANSGECVLCVADANCPPTTPRCAPSNTCIQCLSGADCGGDTPVCKAGTCEACASDADCGGATPACEVWGGCGQCSATNGSACTGGTDVCDFPTGTCVACEFNSDCSGGMPTCNVTTHTCRPCATNDDCADNPSGAACVTSGMKAGSCVLCAIDADCTSLAAPKCDTTANLCVACLTSGDCAAPTPVCNGSSLCVGCLTSADCSGATPVCDTASSQCKACANDYSASNPGPLPCPVATSPACQPAGSALAGQCALCSSLDNAACASVPATPVCITSTATCGCAKDTDCNPDSYCDTTTVSSGTCTAGCREVSSVDNCATGKYCSKSDGTVGTCTTEPCNGNGDCTAPNGVCNTIVQPHGCVACLNDPDCANGQVCDQADHCVDCTANQKQNCVATGAGAACLAAEVCGCASDADCGDATSGRVCDSTKQACVVGCRGTGGNGCPSPETCSSTDGTAGQCQGAGTTSSSSATGAGGTGGATSGTSTGGAGGDHLVTQSAGCGCRTEAGDDSRVGGLGGLLVGLWLVARRRSGGRGGSGFQATKEVR